ncbi:MFS transporter [Candidatus Sumerlaeota bacterium]|nr:MFS transporter [Candidatus Sumerlaeota bacterium]
MTSSSHTSLTIPREQARKSWRYVMSAAALGAVYFEICHMGAPRTKFLLQIGARPVDFQIISAFISLSLAFQIVGGVVTNRLARRKVVWMTLAVSHRLMVLGVLAAPLVFVDNPRMRVGWVVVVLFVNHTLMNLGSPMWASWMADIVPRDAANRYWAGHQRFGTTSRLLAIPIIALIYRHFETGGHPVAGFVVLALVGIVLGVIDISLFSRVPEPPVERLDQTPLTTILTQPLRDPEYRSFLIFRAYWQFSVAMAAPLFMPFVISHLGIDAWKTQILWMAGPLGAVLAFRFWGMLCDTYGNRPILLLTLSGKAMIPFAFMIAPRDPMRGVPLLAVCMFLDGMLNAGLMVSMQVIVLKLTPRRNRSMYIAATNFLADGIFGATASFLACYVLLAVGAKTFAIWGHEMTGYHVCFAISVLMRYGAVFLAARFREAQSIPVKTVLSHLRKANPLRVVRWLYRLQESTDDSMRGLAARRLGGIRSPLAIRGLIQALEDPSRAVRHEAATALGRIGMAEAAEPLARALFDPDSGIHSPAAEALGAIGGPDSLQALLKNLTHLKPEALAETIDSLGRIGDSAAILPLICLFDQVEDEDLRRRIAAALGNLSDTDSVEEIKVLFRRSRPLPHRM